MTLSRESGVVISSNVPRKVTEQAPLLRIPNFSSNGLNIIIPNPGCPGRAVIGDNRPIIHHRRIILRDEPPYLTVRHRTTINRRPRRRSQHAPLISVGQPPRVPIKRHTQYQFPGAHAGPNPSSNPTAPTDNRVRRIVQHRMRVGKFVPRGIVHIVRHQIHPIQIRVNRLSRIDQFIQRR